MEMHQKISVHPATLNTDDDSVLLAQMMTGSSHADQYSVIICCTGYKLAHVPYLLECKINFFP